MKTSMKADTVAHAWLAAWKVSLSITKQLPKVAIIQWCSIGVEPCFERIPIDMTYLLETFCF